MVYGQFTIRQKPLYLGGIVHADQVDLIPVPQDEMVGVRRLGMWLPVWTDVDGLFYLPPLR
jgi:hypothetical protein